ncbi:MAG: calcium/sodium antiporter [Gammaproteobacteria bacterium]|nr:calcium/sodium antiporter [Gammaproteobacteria bacterium]
MYSLVYLYLIIGLLLISYGASLLVSSTENIANKFNISHFISSFIFIGIATSAPEIFISIISTLDGSGNIAIGNALGSNIANICFVFALTILLFRSRISKNNKILSIETKFFIIIVIILSMLMYPILKDGVVTVANSITLLIFFTLSYYLYKKYFYLDIVDAGENHRYISKLRIFIVLITGLTLLLTGTKIFLDSSITIAESFGISDYVIGLSITAIGTSLPELASSIESARKKNFDFIIGNVLGSNIFNIAIVISIVGFLDNGLSQALSELNVIRDIAMILITTLGFYIIIKNYNQYLTKILCLVLLFSYILYQFNLYGINI